MEKKTIKEKTSTKIRIDKKGNSKKGLTIDEMNIIAKEYFKTHELPEHLKSVVGSINAGNKTIKQLMLE